jgi:hypothetical protein
MEIMFSTRQTGNVHTSVRQHPIKLMILGLAVVVMGIASFPFGVPLVLLGGWLLFVGGRQFGRAVKVFFS